MPLLFMHYCLIESPRDLSLILHFLTTYILLVGQMLQKHSIDFHCYTTLRFNLVLLITYTLDLV